MEQDGATFLKPRDYFNWIARNNYQRRLKMDPLWCMTIMAGYDKTTDEFFLGQCDLYGTRIEHNFLQTGLSAHFCQVLMQNAWKEDMTEDEARKLMCDCQKVLFYRDKKAYDKLQIATVTKAGVTMHEPIQVETEWNHKFYSEKTNEFWRPARIHI